MTSCNIVTHLEQAAQRVPERSALIAPVGGGERAITFAELWREVAGCAAGLRQAGLRPGDRVIVMIPMSIELYVALLGTVAAGGVAVFVDPWVGMRRIAAFAAFAEPRGYLGTPRSHLLRLGQPVLRGLPLTVTTGWCLAGLPARHRLAKLAATPPLEQPFAAGPDDPALITFTTGSSGTPKGANRTHGFLAAQYAALQAEFPCTDAAVDMPMFPVFALRNLGQGLTSVLPAMDFRHLDATDGALIAAQMRRHGVTRCTASPTFLDRLVEHLRDGGAPIPTLRHLLTGGAPVSDAQLRQWQAALPDAEITIVYGSTEAEPVAHLTAAERLTARSARHPRMPGYCLGHPAPRVRTRIAPLTREPAPLDWAAPEPPPGTIGELLVAGDHVCRDYYRNPEATREHKLHGPDGTVWHRMGDTVYRDDDGRLWLVGRVHTTIWRAGQPLHAQLVEQAARGDDPDLEVAAFGMPDAELGTALVVRQVRPKDWSLTDPLDRPDRVRQRLAAVGIEVDRQTLSPKPLPRDPRHHSKVDYAALVHEHEQLDLRMARARARSITAASPFAARLRAYLAERFPLLSHGVLIVSYYSANQFLAQVLTTPGSHGLHLHWRTLAGAVALFCVFFHLRVFDEHKDYAEDCRYHPHRVLQRGLITLRHLKILGALAIGLELSLAALVGWPALVALLLALGFSLLMLKEFFLGAWLRERFLLYSLSHMLIMPLLALQVFSFTTGRYPWQAPPWFWLYAFVGFFVTLNWEISRKIRAPEDELAGLASYSRTLGTFGAAYAVIAIRLIDTGMVYLVGWHLGLSPWFYGVLAALFLVCCYGLYDFRVHTSPRSAKRMETYAGMYIIAFDLTLAVELLRLHGLGGR
jgi:acyl-CoA synthetase (AMP-forming)/AMP-acid ligase II/4-hydroxybenzoate polyprenyltransferase